MANVSVSASTPTASVQAQLYAKDVWREARVNSFWKNMMGQGPNNVIQVKNDFAKQKGDAINYDLFPDLTSRGFAGSNAQTLEGDEESVTIRVDTVLLDQLRHAMRVAGKLDEQRAAIELRPEMKSNLAYWWTRRMDDIIFKKLSGTTYTDADSATFGEAATANTHVLYGGSKLAKNELTSSDTFTLDLLRKAKTIAKTGVRGSTTIWRMRPMNINGKPYYGCVLHPYHIFDLQGSQAWEQAQREAGLRGAENPIFSGAIGIWNGIVLYEHDLVVTGSNAGPGADQPYADALFFGLQAGMFAEAQENPSWVEKQFDYDNQWGVATDMIFGFDKTTFNSQDFAVIKLQTYAANPA